MRKGIQTIAPSKIACWLGLGLVGNCPRTMRKHANIPTCQHFLYTFHKFLPRYISALILRIPNALSNYLPKDYSEFSIEFSKRQNGPLFNRRYVFTSWLLKD